MALIPSNKPPAYLIGKIISMYVLLDSLPSIMSFKELESQEKSSWSIPNAFNREPLKNKPKKDSIFPILKYKQRICTKGLKAGPISQLSL